VLDQGRGLWVRTIRMVEEVASTTLRSTPKKAETDPERIVEQLATAIRQAGYECVIVLPSVN